MKIEKQKSVSINVAHGFLLMQDANQYHIADGSCCKRPHDAFAPEVNGDGEEHADELGERIVGEDEMPIADSVSCQCTYLDEGDVAKAVHHQESEYRCRQYLA